MRDIDHIEPLPKTKKPVLIFTCADKNNFQYTILMVNSLTKFHKPGDVDIVVFTDEDSKEQLAKLPKGVEVRDLKPYYERYGHPGFYYRQKPTIAEEYIRDYELVLGLDSDQIITGSLDYILNTKDYDIGTVMNWNRTDVQTYGPVQGWGIGPVEYFNCGLVAMRSEKFVHHWNVLCDTPQYERLQYREQDLLNILCYYGNYDVRCFDHGDGIANYNAWHGLVAKGELLTAIVKDGEIIVPKGEGEHPFPIRDMTVKVIHAAGGNIANKMNYHTWTNDEVAQRLDILTAQTK